jgi:hypothetical protein
MYPEFQSVLRYPEVPGAQRRASKGGISDHASFEARSFAARTSG